MPNIGVGASEAETASEPTAPLADLRIGPLKACQAKAAASIHAEGQPGTFLTSLGLPFLRALYTSMALSPTCFGHVSLEGAEVVGMAVGTENPAGVFKSLLLGSGPGLALSVMGACLRRPSLVIRVIETMSYTGHAGTADGEAELLFIGTRGDRRRQGIAQALFQAFASSCRERGLHSVGLSVDDTNEAAKRFHLRNGMHHDHSFTLYRRIMHWYRLSLESSPALGTEEKAR